MSTVAGGIRRWHRSGATLRLVFRESFAAFLRNQHLDTAAMLSYYGFLSLIPLLLLGMVLASRFVLASDAAQAAVAEAASNILPDLGGAVLKELQSLAAQGFWSLLSLVVLFWSITPLAAAIRGTFNRVFTPDRTYGFFRSKLRDLAGTLALLGLFFLVVVGKIVVGTLTHRFSVQMSAGFYAVNLVATFAFSVAALCFLYFVFTPVRLRLVELLGGALAAGALLFLLRPAFAWFLRFNPNYGFAFGSLKAVFLLFTWVYFCFVIVLYGAEVMAGARRRDVVLLRTLLTGGADPSKAHGVLVDKFVQRCEAGELIFREGEEGHVMYYVRSGAVELRHGDQPLRVMRRGEYFGEMSMLIDTPRTATALGAEPGTELVLISRGNFDTILRENPQIAQAILKEMVLRLKATDERLRLESRAPSNPPAAPEEERADRMDGPTTAAPGG